jgi:hypothetical protein
MEKVKSILKPGVAYDVQLPGDTPIGYFLNDVYYECGYESGRLDGEEFIYYMVDGTGKPKFPNNVSGYVRGLEIIMDGKPVYQLVERK